MAIKNIKDAHDTIKTIVDIIEDPKFSNIVPEIINGLTRLMGAGSHIGGVFLQIHKPAFEALDAAIAAAEKNWPLKAAAIDLQNLMDKLQRGNDTAINVLGEPARSLTMADFFKLGEMPAKKMKNHIAQLDKLINVNFDVCLALSKIDAMIKHVDVHGKRESQFDSVFWKAIKHHHQINIAKFKTSYSGSVTRLVNHRNGWAKWFGVPLLQRPRNTLIL